MISCAFDTKSYESPKAVVDPIVPYLSDESQEDKDKAQNKEDAALVLPKFNTLKGIVTPLNIHNIDTEMTTTKEVLKTIQSSGLGFAAFAEL